MKKNNLFLDDFRNPIDAFNYTKLPIYNIENWNIVRSFEEFKQYILNKPFPDIISFDHDLEEENTGYDCLIFLIEYLDKNNLSIPRIIFHTQNPAGFQNMKSYLQSYIKSKTI